MPARILSLRRYERPRQSSRFDDLPPAQRAVAEAHFHRLCARWGDDLTQWRRAILVGRAKDLAIRPRDARWAHGMRRRRTPKSPTPAVTRSVSHRRSARPATAGTRVAVDSPQLMPVTPPVGSTNLASSLASTIVASDASLGAPPPLADSPLSSPPSGAVRLDLYPGTASGTDGYDTQRILRDLDNAFGRTVRFSMAVPGKDLPPRWAWHLEVVPVP